MREREEKVLCGVEVSEVMQFQGAWRSCFKERLERIQQQRRGADC